jgi:hypothetical protein
MDAGGQKNGLVVEHFLAYHSEQEAGFSALRCAYGHVIQDELPLLASALFSALSGRHPSDIARRGCSNEM